MLLFKCYHAVYHIFIYKKKKKKQAANEENIPSAVSSHHNAVTEKVIWGLFLFYTACLRKQHGKQRWTHDQLQQQNTDTPDYMDGISSY